MAGTDDDGVGKRAHAVQMEDVLWTRDVARIAVSGRDVAVDALTQVSNRKRRTTAYRQVKVEQRSELVGQAAHSGPGAVAAQLERGFRRLRSDGGEISGAAEREVAPSPLRPSVYTGLPRAVVPKPSRACPAAARRANRTSAQPRPSRRCRGQTPPRPGARIPFGSTASFSVSWKRRSA